MIFIKLLTLDLSTKNSGYAIGTDGKLETHGSINSSSSILWERIIKMSNQIEKIFQQHKDIDKIILEDVLLQKYNTHVTKVLMWLQGIILSKAYQINPSIEYDFIPVGTWRAALNINQGRGIKRDALKKKDIEYAENKYNIKVKDDDQADAICLFDAYWIGFNDEINW